MQGSLPNCGGDTSWRDARIKTIRDLEKKCGRVRIVGGGASGKPPVAVFLDREFDYSRTVGRRLVVALDPGYRYVGFAVCESRGGELAVYCRGVLRTRVPEIKELMTDRRSHRRFRRYLSRYKKKRLSARQGRVLTKRLLHAGYCPAFYFLCRRRNNKMNTALLPSPLNVLESKTNKKRITNVATVPQLSPFRYPGGKTWLVPEIRAWLQGLNYRPRLFIEPFAGGAIASLTAVMENWAERAILCELDDQVAAVWETIFEDGEWLIDQILSFVPTLDNVHALLEQQPVDRKHLGSRR